MQNLKSAKPNKSGNTAWKVFVVVAVVGMVGAGIFTVRNVMGRNASAAEGTSAGEGQIAVAIANTDIPEGGTFADAYDIVAMDESIVPANAITSGSDFDGGVAAIGISSNTVLTQSMVVHADLDENTDDTSRLIAVNYVTLDTGVEEGDYVDIRLKKYGSEDGLVYEDDVVLSKKKVHAIAGQEVTLSLSEKEQLSLGVAAVDASMYGADGSDKTATLYCTRYVNAAQEKAVVTYENVKLSALINSNPNLIAEAQRKLARQQAAAAQQTLKDDKLEDNSGVETKK